MTESGGDAWLAEVRAVVREVLRSDATEFEYSDGELRLRLRRRPGRAVLEAWRAAAVEAASNLEAEALVPVCAPLAGIFYGAPAPGADPYVRPGDWVEAGGVVGLIEAMKVFNEVQAERTGRAARMLATDGALVQAGEPLLLLDPLAAPPPSQGAGRG
jgi:acetyl-CoA carboxylase biotin carboxyl carrier protein